MGLPLLVARDAENGALVAVSERGSAPEATPSPTEVLARRLVGRLGLPDLPLVRATQVHGSEVAVVEEAPPPGGITDAGPCDALVTRLSGVGLVVQTADCVPVLLSSRGTIGAIHAGWRGAASGVASAAAEIFLRLAGDPDGARAWLGPAIGPCCYEVGSEVAERFAGAFVTKAGDRRPRLDLRAVVRSQLEAAGIRQDNIMQPCGCTMCGGERFASFRRDGARAGRMIALVARFPTGS